jgi:hypothetical protein
MNEDNPEEAWFAHTINEFQYIVNSGKYGPHFYKFLSEQTKQVLANMYELEKRGLELKCPSQLG